MFELPVQPILDLSIIVEDHSSKGKILKLLCILQKWILQWKVYTLVAWGLNVLVTRFLTNLCKDFNRALKKFRQFPLRSRYHIFDF
nr:hypothetical protein Iba_chr11aCG18240 [Ipomoea batatas]